LLFDSIGVIGGCQFDLGRCGGKVAHLKSVIPCRELIRFDTTFEDPAPNIAPTVNLEVGETHRDRELPDVPIWSGTPAGSGTTKGIRALARTRDGENG
jgi:hypothetical protein